MLYFLILLIFFVALLFIVFSNDGFLNSEMTAYQKTLQEPWLERIVALNL